MWWALLGLIGGLIGFFQLKDRDRRRANQVLALGAALSAVGVVLAVVLNVVIFSGVVAASNALAEQTSTYVPGPLSPPPATTAPATSSAAVATAPRVVSTGLRGGYPNSFTAVYTVDYAGANGYTSRARFGFGAVQKYTVNDPSRDPGTCGVNAQTDGLVPFVVETENTTATFEQRVRARMLAGKGFGSFGGHPLSFAAFFSDGPSCNDWSSIDSSNGKAISLRSTEAMSGTKFSALQGYIILKDYYSPANPGGDTALAKQLSAIAPTYTYNDDDGQSGTLTVTACSGTGALLTTGFGTKNCSMPFGQSI